MFQHYVLASTAAAMFPPPSQTIPPSDSSWLAAVATMFRTTLESCGLKSQHQSDTVEIDPNNIVMYGTPMHQLPVQGIFVLVFLFIEFLQL